MKPVDDTVVDDGEDVSLYVYPVLCRVQPPPTLT